MIMALDDACLACCSSTLYDVEEKTVNDIHSNVQTFLRKYEALNSDELAAALMVNFNDLIGTLSNEVTCVGCRRSVECMLQKLHDSGDSALEPLVITDDKVISVNRDHLLTPQALANLFCNQLHRLKTAYIEPITGEFYFFVKSFNAHSAVCKSNTHAHGVEMSLRFFAEIGSFFRQINVSTK